MYQQAHKRGTTSHRTSTSASAGADQACNSQVITEQCGRVEAAAAEQRAAVSFAAIQAMGGVSGTFDAQLAGLDARFSDKRAELTGVHQAHLQRIEAHAASEKRRMHAAVEGAEPRVDEERQALVQQASQLGKDQAERVRSHAATGAEQAMLVATEKRAQYAEYDDAREIGNTAENMAEDVAVRMHENAEEVAPSLEQDGLDLAETLRTKTTDSVDFDEGLPEAEVRVDEMAARAVEQAEQAYAQAREQLVEAQAQAAVQLETERARAMGEADVALSGLLLHIDGAAAQATSAVAQAEGAEAPALTGAVDGIVSDFGAVGGQTVAALSGMALSAGQDGGLVEQGADNIIEGYQTAGQAQLDSISQEADGFIDSVEDRIERAVQGLRDVYDEGAQAIVDKADDVVSRNDALLKELPKAIDEKAKEIDSRDFWGWVGAALGGFFKGFFGQLWLLTKVLAGMLLASLISTVLMLAVVAALVLLFPSLLPLALAGFFFFAVYGPVILTFLAWTMLAVTVLVALYSIYKAIQAWRSKEATWEERWDTTGRAACDTLIALIGVKVWTAKPVAGGASASEAAIAGQRMGYTAGAHMGAAPTYGVEASKAVGLGEKALRVSIVRNIGETQAANSGLEAMLASKDRDE